MEFWDEDAAVQDPDQSGCCVNAVHSPALSGVRVLDLTVMACDDDIVPLQERIETVADDADLEEIYDTERHLLYVACTRARDRLLVTGVMPASEFLDDFIKPKSAGR
jgi:hypothetical protein